MSLIRWGVVLLAACGAESSTVDAGGAGGDAGAGSSVGGGESSSAGGSGGSSGGGESSSAGGSGGSSGGGGSSSAGGSGGSSGGGGSQAGGVSGQLSIRPFAKLPAGASATEWSTGQTRITVDPISNDWLILRWSNAQNQLGLTASRNEGATWSTIATDVDNPLSGTCSTGPCYQWPRVVLSAVADSSGRLHALTAGTAGNLRYFYQRFELLRANGHVTGLHRAIDPIALPDHGRHPSADLRGDLIIATNSGQNVVVYAYDTSVGTSLDNVRVFAGRSTNALPMTSADFTGIDGAGGDSLLFRSDGGTVLISHLMQALVVQGRASEDLFFVVGQLNGDHVVPIAPTPDYALRAIPARKQTTGWTIAAPVIIAAAGGVEPQLLDVHSSTLAWVMYLDPVSGIRFGSFDAQGAFTSRPGPIESGAGMRAAFGSFTADGSGRIWAVWHTYGHANALSPLGGMSAFDGTAWSTTRDPNPIDCNGFGSTDGLERGAAAVRFDGQLLPQINDLPSVGSFIQR